MDFTVNYADPFRIGVIDDNRIRINCMKELWTFLGESFCDTGKYIKGVHKAGNWMEYEAAVRMLFANCDLQPLKDGLPHSVITAGTLRQG